MDWENGAGLPEWIPKAVEMPLYLHAVGNTRLVGRQIAILVMNLGDHFDEEPMSNKMSKKMAQNTHVIGHSLGGQIAGYAGEHLRLMNHNLARITGIEMITSINNNFPEINGTFRFGPGRTPLRGH